MAPKTAEKAASKAMKPAKKGGKKGKKSVESWKIYIYKVRRSARPFAASADPRCLVRCVEGSCCRLRRRAVRLCERRCMLLVSGSKLCEFRVPSLAAGTMVMIVTECCGAVVQVLKQVHPDTGISSKAISILNSFIQDQFEKIAGEAAKLARYTKKVRHTAPCAFQLFLAEMEARVLVVWHLGSCTAAPTEPSLETHSILQ